ncbi:hypothetical protein GOP47_0022532 [Adiantum capillus-veneris]|uniref:Uncharacterized protein n=1 Tax=Adiantum capillus-veneris TaxID=13818 RepID=A0A9D4U5R2_ADICA|nr:hypothetical protein GOP47_0022532 [Adiantum capillus-veneris]
MTNTGQVQGGFVRLRRNRVYSVTSGGMLLQDVWLWEQIPSAGKVSAYFSSKFARRTLVAFVCSNVTGPGVMELVKHLHGGGGCPFKIAWECSVWALDALKRLPGKAVKWALNTAHNSLL